MLAEQFSASTYGLQSPTPRRVYGDRNNERTYENTDPPRLPVAPRTMRKSLLQDMLIRDDVVIAVIVWESRYPGLVPSI
jgi:hypothetical protein